MATANDRAVIEAMFNPLGAEVPIEVDCDEDSENADRDMWSPSSEETHAVALAEAGRLEEALGVLDDLIKRTTSVNDQVSLRNDRAQVHRLLGNVSAAGRDLDTALALGGCRRVRRQALVQKSLLERLAGRRNESRALLESAAALGSRFARHQLNAEPVNPYAALCNQMLRRMFADLRGEDCSTNMNRG